MLYLDVCLCALCVCGAPESTLNGVQSVDCANKFVLLIQSRKQTVQFYFKYCCDEMWHSSTQRKC